MGSYQFTIDKISKPCPFCNGTKLKLDSKSVYAKHITIYGVSFRCENHTYSVRCNSCHARGPASGGKVIPYNKTVNSDIEELHKLGLYTDSELASMAVDLWNQRSN